MRRRLTLLIVLSAGMGLRAQTGVTIAAPAGGSFYGLTPQFAVSPDARQVVFVGNAAGGPTMLWVRPVESGMPRPLPGTEQASYPFWSADGVSIGFFASGKLKTIAAAGGGATVVCDAPNGRGGTWNVRGVIVFASGITDPLRRVSAAGGVPTQASTLDTPREGSHRFPQFLPDGEHLLYWAGAGSAPPALRIGSLSSTDAVTVAQADINGAVGGGMVFYGKANAVMAQAIDKTTFLPSGAAVRVAEPLSADAGSNFGSLSAAADGTLLYTKGSARPFVLTWFDRAGRVLGRVGEPGLYTNVALSPDDKRIAVSLTTGAPPNRDVYVLDAATGAATRLTTHPAVDASPVWSPDGSRIAFSSQRDGPYQIYLHDLAAHSDQRLLTTTVGTIATDWSAGGVMFVQGTQMGLLSPGSSAEPMRFSEGDNLVGARTMAFQSARSGRTEIYEITADATRQRSADGGTQPLWRRDGNELFFLAPDGSVMSSLNGAPPAKLFSAPPSLVIRRTYAVTSDGQRILMPILDDRVVQTILVVRR